MRIDTSMRPVIFFAIAALTLLSGGCANHRETAEASLPPERLASYIETLEQEQRALLAEVEAELRLEVANSKGNREAEERVTQLQELLLEIKQRIKDQNKRTKFIDGDIAEEPYRAYVQRIKSEIASQGQLRFPAEDGKKLYGFAVMLITIEPSGSISSIDSIKASSDQIATKARELVMSASPYTPFPAEVADTNKKIVMSVRLNFVRG